MQFNGQVLSDATAFVVQTKRGPLLMTNRHNVTGRHNETGELLSSRTGAIPNEVTIFHNAQAGLGYWVPRTEPLYRDEIPLWIEHPILKNKADFVGLPLTMNEGIAFYPYNPAEPGPEILIGPSDMVSVVGFPFGKSTGGNFAIWATGFVASEYEIESDPTFFIDCRSRQGQSGSPVIAYRSGGAIPHSGGINIYPGSVYRFIGIYSGRINKESDLGIVWKSKVLAELVYHYESIGAAPSYAQNGSRPIFVKPQFNLTPTRSDSK